MALDLLFPMICTECKSPSQTPYFCQDCWEHNQLADPQERCRHCFGWIDPPRRVCSRCASGPWLPFPRAALFDRQAPICQVMMKEESAETCASFAWIQWQRLRWARPDLIVPIPPQQKEVARLLATTMQRPLISLFRRSWDLRGRERWAVRHDQVDDETVVLLFDVGCSSRQLRLACEALLEAFPKKGYLLSLGA